MFKAVADRLDCGPKVDRINCFPLSVQLPSFGCSLFIMISNPLREAASLVGSPRQKEGPRRTADPFRPTRELVREGVTSFDVLQRFVESDDVGSEVLAVCAHVLVR